MVEEKPAGNGEFETPSPGSAPTSRGRVHARPSASSQEHIPPQEVTRSRVQPDFMRQRAPHITQSAIDDLAQDGVSVGEYTHDSNVAIRGGAFSGRPYRKARGGMGQVKGNRYGRYLEVPKGKRSIFESPERTKRRRSIISTVAVVVFLVAVAIIVWMLIHSTL